MPPSHGLSLRRNQPVILRKLGKPTLEDDEPPLASDRPVFRTRFALEMPAKELEETKARLVAFKTLRNRIVHHFLEDHDLLTLTRCEQAMAVVKERGSKWG